jgi:hypothetical protein
MTGRPSARSSLGEIEKLHRLATGLLLSRVRESNPRLRPTGSLLLR